MAAGALSLAGMASLLSAASAFGAVSCSYSGSDHLLTVAAADSFAGIARSGDAIAVDDGFAAIPCTGGSPTVFNTDRVRVTHSGRRGDRVDLSGGPFAPGATLEPQGTSEIEFEYADPTYLDIHGTTGPDLLTFGSNGGVNLNGDDDVDVTGQFTAIVLEGRGGNDLITPQSDYSGTGANLLSVGGAGNDTLIAAPDGGVLHGGGGADKIIGGPKVENITGGLGSDLIRAGKGRDIIRAIDGTKDRVFCGGGFDKVKADRVDKLHGCERLITTHRG